MFCHMDETQVPFMMADPTGTAICSSCLTECTKKMLQEAEAMAKEVLKLEKQLERFTQ
jgi:ATP-dependent protease Clp ATPase subunit